jgi:phosphopantothenoylcysteine decarboxylase/phosphopantothenate--cysteine ligase
VKSLKNKKVLLTAGPTREYWDPVRYFTNSSSGRMGVALAHYALRHGARVTLVLGPVEVSVLHAIRSARLHIVPVVSAWEMYEAVKKHLAGTDFFLGTAAVVDYRPDHRLKHKLKREESAVVLKLQGNPDIIAMVGHNRDHRPKTVVGFALETENLVEHAQDKMYRKRLDWIVANHESNLGGTEGAGTLLSRWGHRIQVPKMPKEKLAQKIWQAVLS